MKIIILERWPNLKIRLALFFGCFFFLSLPSEAQNETIGFIYNEENTPEKEVQAGMDFLKSIPDFEVVVLPLDKMDDTDLKDIDHLWYHRPDTTAILPVEKKAGKAIKEFVAKGGNLLLSLDAVRLLNSWGIEQNGIASASALIKDDGFGRKLGFHSFRQHPLFEGLHGGAYVWHSKQDHEVRKLGFFGDDLPAGPNARIIGIDWAYITFHEDSKLVWEYTLGKGKILAVGAYTYFGKPNYSQDQLHRFFENAFAYFNQVPTGQEYFWSYEINAPKQVELDQGQRIDIITGKDDPWVIPEPYIQLSRNSATDNYWDLPGTRLLLMGREKSGFEELWAHPFMAFRDYKSAVKIGDSKKIIMLESLIPAVKFSPGVMVRTYNINGDILKEVSTVSVDAPNMLIHYEWTGFQPIHLAISVTTNLRFMWPYSEHSTGTIGYQWSKDLNSLLITDLKTHTMNSMIGFNQAPVNQKIGNYESFDYLAGIFEPKETEKNQITGGFEFLLSKTDPLNIMIAAGEPQMSDLVESYKLVAARPNELLKKTMSYYEDLGKRVMKIETPDSVFNEGFEWAMAGADQFMVETPGVGKSLVAGYGTTASGWRGGHQVSGRPGYAWYFGRDAQWSGFALDAYGDFDSVKEILKTFNNFQHINGKIFHELTTSGSVHFDAADSTPLYVLLASHYLKASGDIGFIEKTWKNLEKAMNYCYSTDTDGDGLIENTNVGHGWIEGGALYGAHTTFYLAGIWAATLREAAYLAREVGEEEKALAYEKDYLKVQEQVNKEFWNENKEHFNYGLLRNGFYNEELTMLPAVPVYFNVIDQKKGQTVTEKFSSGNFSTDWGVRILEEKSQHFNPGGYHVGSVWPLFTGWTSLAEYETGRHLQGFSHLMNNLQIYKHWDLGSTEEVLNGVTYKPSGVTHNQGWSQTMVLQPILEGMLGIRPDAMNNHLKLSPRLPWNWQYFAVDNIRFGDHYVNFDLNRTDGKTIYDFEYSGEGNATLDFHPLFPLGTVFHSVNLDGHPVEYSLDKESGGIILIIDKMNLKERAQLVIEQDLGLGAIPIVTNPDPGASSRGMKIIKEESKNGVYSLLLEGRPGKEYVLELFAPMKPQRISGATYLESRKNLHQVKVNFPESQEEYEVLEIKIHVN